MPDELEYSCDVCGKQVPTERGLAVHKARLKHNTGDIPDDEAPTDIWEEKPPVEQEIPETPPAQPRGWREKFWGEPKPKPAPAERRPRKRRQNTEGIWTGLWTAGGLALVRTGADIPVGNVLQFQAPVVGPILDEAIAGTFIDTLVQPLAGKGKRFKNLSAVLALPLLVGALERSPGAAPVLEPLLRATIQEHLVAMAPVVKAQQKKEAEYRKALAELGMDADGADDPVDAIIASIFVVPPSKEPAGAPAA